MKSKRTCTSIHQMAPAHTGYTGAPNNGAENEKTTMKPQMMAKKAPGLSQVPDRTRATAPMTSNVPTAMTTSGVMALWPHRFEVHGLHSSVFPLGVEVQ